MRATSIRFAEPTRPETVDANTSCTPQKHSLSEFEAYERSAWLYRYWLACNAADPAKTMALLAASTIAVSADMLPITVILRIVEGDSVEISGVKTRLQGIDALQFVGPVARSTQPMRNAQS